MAIVHVRQPEKLGRALAAPGRELTADEAERIEHYLKEPEGVTVTVSTWHESQLAMQGW